MLSVVAVIGLVNNYFSMNDYFRTTFFIILTNSFENLFYNRIEYCFTIISWIQIIVIVVNFCDNNMCFQITINYDVYVFTDTKLLSYTKTLYKAKVRYIDFDCQSVDFKSN